MVKRKMDYQLKKMKVENLEVLKEIFTYLKMTLNFNFVHMSINSQMLISK
jgi:hypothetical protein